MKKTDDQITKEVAALQIAKSMVPQLSTFNDNNHQAIDAQIEVLSNQMGIGNIEYAFDSDEEYKHRLDAAIYAHDWMFGFLSAEDDIAPSVDWETTFKGGKNEDNT